MTVASEVPGEAALDRWTLKLLAAIRQYWLLVSLVTLAAAVCGYAVSYTRTVVYRATVVAVPANQSGGEGLGLLGQLRGLTEIAGIDIGGSAENSESLATLRSRQFSDAFMRQAGINRRVCELYCKDVQPIPGDDSRLAVRAIDAFEANVRRIDEDRQAGVVRVSIVWPDRVEAAALANQMFAHLNEVLRARARAEAEASLKYLQIELDRTNRIELRQALFRLVERQTARIMAANVTADYAYRVIDPAMPPDVARPESPRRLIWALVAGIIGGALSLLVALVLNRKRK